MQVQDCLQEVWNENRHQITQADPASGARPCWTCSCLASLLSLYTEMDARNQLCLLIPLSVRCCLPGAVLTARQTLEVLPGYLLPKDSVSSCNTFLEMTEKTSYLFHPYSVEAALFLTKHIWLLLLCSHLSFKSPWFFQRHSSSRVTCGTSPCSPAV